MNCLEKIREDITSVFERDPAARNVVEVLLCYPGLHALWLHRITHRLWQHGSVFQLISRLLSQWGRFWTGIEIHPGARIGRRFFIDHGMGIVIGETAEIGDDVTLFQGVTLGGTGKEQGKRHPTIHNGVFIGCGASVLGNITIGENTRIGGGSVVLRNIPENSTVVGVPGHVLYRNGERVIITDPKEVKDPLSDVIIALSRQVQDLKLQVKHILQETTPAACSSDEALTQRFAEEDL
jgi:serine O-acetyltransferase